MEAAERQLIAGGPQAVKVQRIGRELGLTDAAIHYHFGSRELLLKALLHFASRRFSEALEAALDQKDGTFDMAEGARRLLEFYERRGTARLVTWLVLAGWTPPGSGMLTPLVDTLHARALASSAKLGRPRPTRKEYQRRVALLSAVAVSQALFGDAIVRSVGLEPEESDAFFSWIVKLVERA